MIITAYCPMCEAYTQHGKMVQVHRWECTTCSDIYSADDIYQSGKPSQYHLTDAQSEQWATAGARDAHRMIALWQFSLPRGCQVYDANGEKIITVGE